VQPVRRIRKTNRNSYKCYNNITSQKYRLSFTMFQVLQPICRTELLVTLTDGKC
jgi:hypothetical protein